MLNEIVEFFRKERSYAYLLLGLVLVYGIVLVIRARETEKETKPKSKILQSYEQAEHRLQSKLKNKGSLDAYLKDKPELNLSVNAFSLFAMIGLITGLVLDSFFIWKPGWRDRIRQQLPPPMMEWRFSMLFKFFIWFFAVNVGLSFALLGVRQIFSGNENFYILFHTTCAEIASFALILFMVYHYGGRAQALGMWAPQGWFREIRAGWTVYLGIVPLFAVVLVALLYITELLHYEPPPHPLVPIFLEEQGSKFLTIYSLVLAAFVGPVFEEIFFRGFCYPILKSRMGKAAAMVTTAAFFAFIHENSFAFWPIFVLGLGLTYAYEQRRSLVAPITLHITHNVIFLAYFFLAKSVVSREMGG